MAESIRLGEQVNKLISQLKEIARNTNQSACCTATTSAGSGVSIPAGFSSIAIVQTAAGTVDITLSDGSIFQMTVVGETFVDASGQNKSLPAYVINGTGSWKWHGIK